MKHTVAFLLLLHSIIWAQVSPIVVDVRNGLLLVSDSNTPAKSITGEENYSIYNRVQKIGSGTGSKVEYGSPCEQQPMISISHNRNGNDQLVAIAGDWNPLPSHYKIIPKKSSVYRGIVADILTRNGLTKFEVSIDEIIQTDLNNDGVFEVVITASNFTHQSPYHTNKGDYSVVIIRSVQNGKVMNNLLKGTFCTSGDSELPVDMGVVSILDVDGDGVCEILVYNNYYEGVSTSVYKLTPTGLNLFLSGGCGA